MLPFVSKQRTVHCTRTRRSCFVDDCLVRSIANKTRNDVAGRAHTDDETNISLDRSNNNDNPARFPSSSTRSFEPCCETHFWPITPFVVNGQHTPVCTSCSIHRSIIIQLKEMKCDGQCACARHFYMKASVMTVRACTVTRHNLWWAVSFAFNRWTSITHANVSDSIVSMILIEWLHIAFSWQTSSSIRRFIFPSRFHLSDDKRIIGWQRSFSVRLSILVVVMSVCCKNDEDRKMKMKKKKNNTHEDLTHQFHCFSSVILVVGIVRNSTGRRATQYELCNIVGLITSEWIHHSQTNWR
jgi:hypothetical protein